MLLQSREPLPPQRISAPKRMLGGLWQRRRLTNAVRDEWAIPPEGRGVEIPVRGALFDPADLLQTQRTGRSVKPLPLVNTVSCIRGIDDGDRKCATRRPK
jgi:hypothetical protein